jgi:hypothetical protein
MGRIDTPRPACTRSELGCLRGLGLYITPLNEVKNTHLKTP